MKLSFNFLKPLKNTLPAIVLVSVLAISFAFRPATKEKAKTFALDVQFEYNGGGVNNPLNYTDITGTFDPDNSTGTCPGTAANICVLDLDESLVYTEAEADQFPNDEITDEWIGKPKVDKTYLATGLSDALVPTLQDPYSDPNTPSLFDIYLRS